jgi:colanic acid/amylovoran biosynthesis glycosyltransferase
MTASDGDSEGTPVAILEACASGVPVVATRHAGIVDVIDDGHSGFLVDEGDVGAMTDRLVYLAQHPRDALRLGRSARARVEERFELEQSIGGLWHVIESVLAGQHHS